jgi:hypothetical protein
MLSTFFKEIYDLIEGNLENMAINATKIENKKKKIERLREENINMMQSQIDLKEKAKAGNFGTKEGEILFYC